MVASHGRTWADVQGVRGEPELGNLPLFCGEGGGGWGVYPEAEPCGKREGQLVKALPKLFHISPVNFEVVG